MLQVGIARRAASASARSRRALAEPGELVDRYRRALPFSLTPEQEGAIRELDADLARAVPMQRLLQGDVGSGKTVVALYALLRAVENGRQGALMAPTETLAEQHFLTVEGLCAELGVRCVLLTSALRAREPRPARAEIASGEAQIAVGTHALIQEEVAFHDLAVAVVDEQHRFGVEQRRGAGRGPLPARPAHDGDADPAHARAHRLRRPRGERDRAAAGEPQADRHGLGDGGEELGGVHAPARPPRRGPPGVRRLPADRGVGDVRRARGRGGGPSACGAASCAATASGSCTGGCGRRAARADGRFKAGELDVLVATTVIEVGVDVPNATIMIVQEADRFGLAQLHQLRGRVGRGAEQSFCLLVSRAREQLTETAIARLEALVASTDGFELAEVDLELRGEGQLLGTRQSGLSDLRFTRLRADRALLERARARPLATPRARSTTRSSACSATPTSRPRGAASNARRRWGADEKESSGSADAQAFCGRLRRPFGGGRAGGELSRYAS